MHFDVELDLRLCARRTDRNFAAVCGKELQDIACSGEIHLCHLSAAQICAVEVSVVFHHHYVATGKLSGRICAEILHHLLDFLCSGLARAHHRDAFLMGVSVLKIDFLKHFIEVHATVFCPCADFGHQRDCRHGVLVAAEVFGQEAVAFLTATKIALSAFEIADYAGNPFESGIAVIHLHILILGNSLDGFCRDDCLDHIFIAFQQSELAVAEHDVVQ